MRKPKWMLLLLIMALLHMLAAAGEISNAANSSDKDLMSKVAKLKVGTSTRAQVAKLLGAPWRSMDDRDCHPVDYQYEVWEYLGQDATGVFRIHIGFDEDSVARIIAKIPQRGPITVLESAATSTTHEH
jgi:outer membrane protein assembly factor BamE (lipoprotein component of BamABCDE complex)